MYSLGEPEKEKEGITLPQTIGEWTAYFEKSPIVYGGIDIFGGIENLNVDFSSSLAATALGMMSDKRRLFQQVVMIVPPGFAEFGAESFLESMARKILDHDPGLARDDQDTDAALLRIAHALQPRINFRERPTNEVADLIRIVAQAEVSVFLIVPSATAYSNEREPAPLDKSESYSELVRGRRFWSGEDLWVDDLVDVVVSLSDSLLENKSAALLSHKHPSPVKSENWDKLNTLKLTTLAFAQAGDHNARVFEIERLFPNWLRMAKAQQIDAVVKDIDERIPEPLNNAIVKAQCFVMASRPLRAINLITPHLETFISSPDPDFLISIAGILESAGERDKALKFVAASLKAELESRNGLQIAGQIAEKFSAFVIRDQVNQRIDRLYPQSETSLHHRFYDGVVSGDFSAVADDLDHGANASELIAFLAHLKSRIQNIGLETEQGLIAKTESDYPDFVSAALYYAGLYSSKRGDPEKAAIFLKSNRLIGGMERYAMTELINVIQALFLTYLNSQEAYERVQPILRDSIARVLRFIAEHPADGLRHLLNETVSIGASGYVGVINVLETIPDLDPGFPTLLPDTDASRDKEPSSLKEPANILEPLVRAVGSGAVLGISELPEIEEAYDEREFMALLTDYLKHQADRGFESPEERKFYPTILHIVIKLNQRLDTNGEYEAIGIAATAYVNDGNYQQARNLVEQGLLISNLSGDRTGMRNAWLSFADVYLRCHNVEEAVTAFAAACQLLDGRLTSDELFVVHTLHGRILRDLNRFDEAIATIRLARKLVAETGNPERSVRVLDALELMCGLELMQHDGADTEAKGEVFRQLRTRALAVHRRAKGSRGELLPTAALLGQMNILLVEQGDEPDEEITRELQEFREATSNEFPIHHQAILSGSVPTVKEIEAAVAGIEGSRFLADRATDIFPLVQLARLALSNLPATDKDILYLIELLTSLSTNSRSTFDFNVDPANAALDETARSLMSHAMLKGDLELSREDRESLTELDAKTNLVVQRPEAAKLLNVDGLYGFAKDFVSAGSASILAMALDSEVRLVTVHVSPSQTRAGRDPNFQFEKYKIWQEKYPFEYHKIRSDEPNALNMLEQSLDGIAISLPERPARLVIVAANALQNIPPNFYMSEGELIGLASPVSVVPSLNWLKRTASEKVRWAGKLAAWIPKIDRSDDALTTLFALIEPELTKNGFTVHTATGGLGGLSRSDIAVIGAHGGIGQEADFFRTVSNEGDFRAGIPLIAKALERTNLVILFSCSAGRLDSNPYSERPVGLPFEILDQGCRTVIASPYPIDVNLTRVWLPAFLEEFLSGGTAADANFAANKKVAASFNYNPILSLAMNVFGDADLSHTP